MPFVQFTITVLLVLIFFIEAVFINRKRARLGILTLPSIVCCWLVTLAVFMIASESVLSSMDKEESENDKMSEVSYKR